MLSLRSGDDLDTLWRLLNLWNWSWGPMRMIQCLQVPQKSSMFLGIRKGLLLFSLFSQLFECFEDMGSRRLSIMDEESNAAQKSDVLRAASFQLLRIGVYSDIGLEQGIVLVLGDTVLFQRCWDAPGSAGRVLLWGAVAVVVLGCSVLFNLLATCMA